MCDKVFRRHWKIWAGVTVFVGIFSAVYEHYGRGIYSKPMIYAFSIPLLFGFLPALVLSRKEEAKVVPYANGVRLGINLFCAGVAALLMGSIATGVVEIYGTTNRFMKVYTIAEIVMLFVGMCVACAAFLIQAKTNEDPDEEEGEDGIPFES